MVVGVLALEFAHVLQTGVVQHVLHVRLMNKHEISVGIFISSFQRFAHQDVSTVVGVQVQILVRVQDGGLALTVIHVCIDLIPLRNDRRILIALSSFRALLFCMSKRWYL